MTFIPWLIDWYLTEIISKHILLFAVQVVVFFIVQLRYNTKLKKVILNDFFSKEQISNHRRGKEENLLIQKLYKLQVRTKTTITLFDRNSRLSSGEIWCKLISKIAYMISVDTVLDSINESAARSWDIVSLETESIDAMFPHLPNESSY